MKNLYLILLLAAMPLLGTAQSKITAPTAIWPELQLSYGLGENGLLFLENQYRINTDKRYNGVKMLGNFERVQLALGYEHTFTDHWRAGAIYRYAVEDMPKSNFLTGFVRHSGTVKSLFFNKQAMVEYVNQEQRDPFGRFRLMAELGKRLPLGERFLTPSASFELFVNKELGDDNADRDVRTIDRTRLRLNLTYELNDKLRITPYFLRQTDYYFVEVGPKYDENDVLIQEGYTDKRNRISPIFGLEVKYAFNRAISTGSYTY
ncbi:DUF2490 domain-containing protein [Pontibacter sp. JH31]|uniref:DUF2490 domain-containing protein n=1 Tax=Pontibacter aquaedesilientis TaxID=2766980 RepID=A0ABR7XIY6_9BACT|nr:DUF2490 domain-containing protein [Pontibacter aquaedesilientis]MBD1398252.1 DUF2490 domain-containing protein [Pontibacter aquaedesilientis]